MGDRAGLSQKEQVEAAIRDLDAALKGNSQADIDARGAALSTALQMITSVASPGGQGNSGEQATSGAQGRESHAYADQSGDNDVVDAEFREVKR
jgi:molecular chaperone DnaK